MKYIRQALNCTYRTERKAYPGLNDLIDMLDSSKLHYYEYVGVLRDIDNLLHDINSPIREEPL